MPGRSFTQSLCVCDCNTEPWYRWWDLNWAIKFIKPCFSAKSCLQSQTLNYKSLYLHVIKWVQRLSCIVNTNFCVAMCNHITFSLDYWYFHKLLKQECIPVGVNVNVCRQTNFIPPPNLLNIQWGIPTRNEWFRIHDVWKIIYNSGIDNDRQRRCGR